MEDDLVRRALRCAPDRVAGNNETWEDTLGRALHRDGTSHHIDHVVLNLQVGSGRARSGHRSHRSNRIWRLGVGAGSGAACCQNPVGSIFRAGKGVRCFDVFPSRVALDNKVLNRDVISAGHRGLIERNPNDGAKGGGIDRVIYDPQVAIDAGRIRVIAVDGDVIGAVELNDAGTSRRSADNGSVVPSWANQDRSVRGGARSAAI